MKIRKITTIAATAAIVLGTSHIAMAELPKVFPGDIPKESFDRAPSSDKTPTNKGYSRAKRKAESTDYKPYLYIPKTKFYAKGSGGEQFLNIDAKNTRWSVITPPASWVTTDNDEYGIRITFAENPSNEARSTVMEVGNDINRYIIELYQNGSVKFEVTAIDFANTDERGEKIYSDFGEPLYSYDLNFLYPRVTYNGPEKKIAKSANVRIIKPDGTIDDVEKEGDYTYQWVINAEPGIGNTAMLYPWGNNVKHRGIPYYFPGTYMFQLWIEDELAYTQPFEVKLKPDDYGAQIEDYWVDHNVTYEGKEGMLVHSRINSQNLEGYKINYCVYLKDAEGNQLRDNRDRPLTVQEAVDVESNDFYWDNWSVFVPYDFIKEALGNDNQFTYNIEIQNGETFRPLSRISGLSYSFQQ